MATDYVLRVLYDRLARAVGLLASQISGGGGSATVPEYTTVANMLAANPADIESFARCTNASPGDGIKSLWMRASEETADNGSDVRESTAMAGVFYERIWAKESL